MREQGNEQVRMEQRGQVYFAGVGQRAQAVEVVGVVEVERGDGVWVVRAAVVAVVLVVELAGAAVRDGPACGAPAGVGLVGRPSVVGSGSGIAVGAAVVVECKVEGEMPVSSAT